MKTLHPKIQSLKNATAGQFLTCAYQDNVAVDFGMRAQASRKLPEGQVEAYVAIFGIKDKMGTVAVRGCFAKSIQERGPQSTGNEKIVHLFHHNMHEPIGQLLELEEDAIGLRALIQFDLNVQRAREIYDMTKSGTVRQYSYGFDYVWDKMVYEEASDTILMNECALYETSSVAIRSMNPVAYTIRSVEDFNKRIDELGELSEDAVRNLTRAQRMELKQLFSEYRTLAMRAKPVEPLPQSKPFGLNIDVTKL